MLPLNPTLHRALDRHDLYISALDETVVWLGGYRAPSIIDRGERYGYGSLTEYLDSGKYCRPALYVNSTRTLFEKMGTPELKDAFRARIQGDDGGRPPGPDIPRAPQTPIEDGHRRRNDI